MKFLYALLAGSMLTLSAAPFASAAGLSFVSVPEFPAVGESFMVHVEFEAGSETYNVLDGVVKVPDDLTIERVSTGGSAITLWAALPNFVPSLGQIEFTGGVPEGVGPNQHIRLFTLHARARAPGGYVLTSRGSSAYVSDGSGTRREIPAATARVTVGAPGAAPSAQVRDRRGPEFVVAEVGQEPSLFNGQYYVTFSATDDISGVVAYEVKEGRFASYVPTERYYVIKDQSLETPVWVRATDASGNTVTKKIIGSSLVAPALLGSILVLLALYVWRRRNKRTFSV